MRDGTPDIPKESNIFYLDQHKNEKKNTAEVRNTEESNSPALLPQEKHSLTDKDAFIIKSEGGDLESSSLSNITCRVLKDNLENCNLEDGVEETNESLKIALKKLLEASKKEKHNKSELKKLESELPPELIALNFIKSKLKIDLTRKKKETFMKINNAENRLIKLLKNSPLSKDIPAMKTRLKELKDEKEENEDNYTFDLKEIDDLINNFEESKNKITEILNKHGLQIKDDKIILTDNKQQKRTLDKENLSQNIAHPIQYNANLSDIALINFCENGEKAVMMQSVNTNIFKINNNNVEKIRSSSEKTIEILSKYGIISDNNPAQQLDIEDDLLQKIEKTLRHEIPSEEKQTLENIKKYLTKALKESEDPFGEEKISLSKLFSSSSISIEDINPQDKYIITSSNASKEKIAQLIQQGKNLEEITSILTKNKDKETTALLIKPPQQSGVYTFYKTA